MFCVPEFYDLPHSLLAATSIYLAYIHMCSDYASSPRMLTTGYVLCLSYECLAQPRCDALELDRDIEPNNVEVSFFSRLALRVLHLLYVFSD